MKYYIAAGLAVTLIGVAVLIRYCGNPPPRENLQMAKLLESADRTTIERGYREFIKRLEYGQPETQEIVQAILAAKPDSGVYDTPVTLHRVKIYAKSRLLAEIGTCSGLFRLQGKQYRDRSGVLIRLVDKPMQAMMDQDEETTLETPEPAAEPDGEDAAGAKKPAQKTSRKESAKQVAHTWFQSLMSGDVAMITSLSDVPFAWDGKEIVESISKLKEMYKGIATDKGKRDLKATEIKILDDKNEISDKAFPIDRIMVVVMIGDEGITICVKPGDKFKVVGFSD